MSRDDDMYGTIRAAICSYIPGPDQYGEAYRRERQSLLDWLKRVSAQHSSQDEIRRLRDSLNARTCHGCDSVVDDDSHLDVTMRCTECRAKIGLGPIAAVLEGRKP